MKKRIASFLLAFLMLIPLMTPAFPFHVHADGDDFRCPNCDSWLGDKDFCAECWFCEECEEICPDCGYCHACAVYDKELHCPECGEVCIDPDYGNEPHCESCLRCENCATLVETSDGYLCEDCIEDFEETEGNKFCEYCGVNVIYNDELGEDDDCADFRENDQLLFPGAGYGALRTL